MTQTLSSRTPGPLVDGPRGRVSLVGTPGRLSLRARGDLAPVSAALGLTLPTRIGQRAEREGLEVLRLGPDEFTLLCTQEAMAGLLEACAAIYPDHPHGLVDISGREVTLSIEGPGALDMLSMGCPRDVGAIPVGEGRRTLFDGTSVVLWRDGVDRFRMDIWNSFAPHLLALLRTGQAELAAEAG